MNEEQVRHYENKLKYETDPFDLFEALGKGEKIVIIDARSSSAYQHEHIPGAISFPHSTMDATSTRQLDPSALYVTYCDGIGCNASTWGALKLAKLGFTVKELMGGIEWWKRDGYATAGEHACEGSRLECGCAA